MRRPEGFQSLVDIVAGTKPDDQVALPAAWLRDLLAYACELEQALRAERWGVAELERLEIALHEDAANR